MEDLDCRKCGVHNRDDAELCRMCGAPLRKADASPRGPVKKCAFCGAINDKDAPFCSVCRRLMGAAPADQSQTKIAQKKEAQRIYTDYATGTIRSARASTAGILYLVVALFAVVDMIMTIIITWDFTRTSDYDRLIRDYPSLETAFANLVACQVIRFVFIALAFLGAFAAMRRMSFGVAVAGGVFAVLSVITSMLALVMPMWFFVALVLFLAAIVGLLLVLVSRREFVVS